MSSKKLAALLTVPFFIALGCGKPAAPDDPEVILSRDGNLARLLEKHSEGRPEKSPWMGFWWPYEKNGIAAANGWLGMSAAAKYDAANGRQTVAEAWEKAHHGRRVPGVEGWWGHCNGWSAAATFFPEPTGSIRVNGVRFDVDDIKALLAEASMEVEADFFGVRVDAQAELSTEKYWDTTPNQYLLVLLHYMGRLKKPVLIDRHTGIQVWNHPLAGYRIHPPTPSDNLGARPEAPRVHRVMLTSTIWWARDDRDPARKTQAFNFLENESYHSRTLRMEVWLDGPLEFSAQGKLLGSGNLLQVGGAWRMGSEITNDGWPDYMWVPHDILPSSGYGNSEVDLKWVKEKLVR